MDLTIYQSMKDSELRAIEREMAITAKVYVDMFNNTADLIGPYKDFFQQDNINSILISGFDYSRLINNNASGASYNYFMKCLVRYMTYSGLFENINVSDFLLAGGLGAVYRNITLSQSPDSPDINNLLVGKINKDANHDINPEILAGFVLNDTKLLVPNFSYQYGLKDCYNYNPNWCIDNSRISITQFVNGYRLFDYLRSAKIHISEQDKAINMKKGVASGNLHDIQFKDEYYDITDELVDNTNLFYQKDIDCIALQIFNALDVAHSLCGFVHHDLHGYNILVQRLPEPILIPIYSKSIEIQDGSITDTPYFYIKTRYIPIIIDYGMAYFEFDGNEFKTVIFDNDSITYDFLFSRKYPTSDIYKVLNTFGNFDPRYRRMKEQLLGRDFADNPKRNSLNYTYRQIINKILADNVYSFDGKMHNGTLADSDSTLSRYQDEQFVNPYNLMTDGKLLTANQVCNAQKYGIVGEMSDYDEEYYMLKMEGIIDSIDRNIRAYNKYRDIISKNFHKFDKNRIMEQLYKYASIGGHKIERYISELELMCYNFAGFPELYKFIDSVHQYMKRIDPEDDRTAELGRLTDFLWVSNVLEEM